MKKLRLVHSREEQLNLPLGVRMIDALHELPIEDVRAALNEPGVDDALDIIEMALRGTFRPGFMHSAICAMSLPTRKPKNDTAPIVRQDGEYSLVITPRQRMEPGGPKHFGSDVGTMTKFRQMVRNIWSDVACAYPQARHSVDFSGLIIKLSYADAPTKGQLSLLDDGRLSNLSARQMSKPLPTKRISGPLKPDLLDFPQPPLSYGDRERKFYDIALTEGKGWDVTTMATAFRNGLKTIDVRRTEEDWIKLWTDFCRSYGKTRGPA